VYKALGRELAGASPHEAMDRPEACLSAATGWPVETLGKWGAIAAIVVVALITNLCTLHWKNRSDGIRIASRTRVAYTRSFPRNVMTYIPLAESRAHDDGLPMPRRRAVDRILVQAGEYR